MEDNSAKKGWYDRWYKLMLIPPVLLFILSLVYLASFHSQHGDYIYKDSSLSGGTTITLTGQIDAEALESHLRQTIDDVYIRTTTDITTGAHTAVIIDSSVQPE